MTREESAFIVDKIQTHRQYFLITKNTYAEWGRILEPYDYADVDRKLNEFLENGDNYGKTPEAYQLVKRLIKSVDKAKTYGMRIGCRNCGVMLAFDEYEFHFDKCNSIEYLVTNYEKIYDKKLNKDKLWKLPNKKFWEMYWKFNEQFVKVVEDKDIKKSLIKAIQEYKKNNEREESNG